MKTRMVALSFLGAALALGGCMGGGSMDHDGGMEMGADHAMMGGMMGADSAMMAQCMGMDSATMAEACRQMMSDTAMAACMNHSTP